MLDVGQRRHYFKKQEKEKLTSSQWLQGGQPTMNFSAAALLSREGSDSIYTLALGCSASAKWIRWLKMLIIWVGISEKLWKGKKSITKTRSKKGTASPISSQICSGSFEYYQVWLWVPTSAPEIFVDRLSWASHPGPLYTPSPIFLTSGLIFSLHVWVITLGITYGFTIALV